MSWLLWARRLLRHGYSLRLEPRKVKWGWTSEEFLRTRLFSMFKVTSATDSQTLILSSDGISVLIVAVTCG